MKLFLQIGMLKWAFGTKRSSTRGLEGGGPLETTRDERDEGGDEEYEGEQRRAGDGRVAEVGVADVAEGDLGRGGRGLDQGFTGVGVVGGGEAATPHDRRLPFD